MARQVGGDAAQHLRQIGPRATTGVQHHHVVGRQAVRDVQVLFQGVVHLGHHGLHHRRGGVPHTQLFAQGRIKGFQEGFIEVGHRLATVEAGEEGGPVHPLQGRGGPVQHLHQVQGLEAARLGQLLEQGRQHRRAQMPHRFPPPETDRAGLDGQQRTIGSGANGRGPRPQHPGGEDAVEEGLHQGGAEEAGAFLPGKAHPQGLLQGGAHRRQLGRVPRRFHPGQTVPGIGGQQPGQIFRFRQCGAVAQGTGQIFPQPGAGGAAKGLWCVQATPEGRGARRQLEAFQLGGAARAVLPHQHKVAQIGDQHQPVTLPIAAHLVTGRGEPCIIVGAFHLHHTPLRDLTLPWRSSLHLPGPIQTKIRMACPLVGQLPHTEHLGLEGRPHPVEEGGQGTVAGALPRGAARSARPLELGTVGGHRLGQFVAGGRHGVCCGRA